MSATFAFFPRRRFLPLFITQFLGAFNDNLLKTAFLVMVSYAGLGFAGLPAAQIVNLASGLFILPFFSVFRHRRASGRAAGQGAHCPLGEA